ncbi:hypothetical protein K490DRAFT_46146 [Saccharata proteae CBS 121410]|uniref:G-protein coupled receptors family 2 profile 2 domain-containing protein n=1 Tax=Saccharata proteae CBS 121410 TaxID=1314787 RepID=A0A9P4HUP2_9PEZI|nr:hypothetical protein K490DRAFT_46146 [Saccharata proteae CBS 121410]
MATSNLTLVQEHCPAPFLSEAGFGISGGYFQLSYKIAEGISVAGLAVCLFLIASWIFLPVEKTRRHYLSVCLVVGAISLALGFVVPFAAEPEQCYDDITPNDMYSSLTCAWSGAFIIAGGLSIGMWIFIRALSMHLQICWDVMPGLKFFYLAQGLGWGIVAALFTTTITLTGVSFRFGDACHVNSDHSMAVFWGPLLGMAGASAIVQLATFGYCINVYLKNMWADSPPETESSAGAGGGLPSYSYSSSFRTPRNSARAVYRRVKKVLWLQWRGIVIVVFILIDVVFFSVVFVYLDNRERTALENPEEVLPWVVCLMGHPDRKEECFQMGQTMLVNQATVTAILVMLSLAGLQCWMLLMRWSMVTGWLDYFRDRALKKREFVSLDARRFSSDARAFEMLKISQQQEQAQQQHHHHHQQQQYPFSNHNSSHRNKEALPDYFGKEIQRPYHSPSQSFSVPRVHRRQELEWDPRRTYARGGTGLSMHPPGSGQGRGGGDDYNYRVGGVMPKKT